MPLFRKKILIWGTSLTLSKRPPGRPPKPRPDGADIASKRGGFWRDGKYYTRPGYGQPKEKNGHGR